MKILHVVRGLANSSGTTHIVIPLAEEQAKLGHDVSVFHVQKPGEASLSPDPRLVTSCLFPMEVPTRHLGFSSSFTRAMRRRAAEFDVIHIHAVWNFVTFWAMWCARQACVPYVVAPQGSCDRFAWRFGSPLRRLYARCFEVPLLKRATRIQALTETEEEQVKALGIKAPCAVIPNGVRMGWFERQGEVVRLWQQLGLPAGERTLLFLGRLHPKKGLDILAQAFGRLIEQVSDVTLVVAGDDAGSGYRADVQQMIRTAGAGEKVRFLGEVRGDEKYRTFLGADAFVLPSYWKGLPVAVVEAMGAGLPVVITWNCNLPEVQEHGAGKVVEAEPGAFSRALETLLSEPHALEECGSNGAELVRSRFTWRKIALSTERLYLNLSEADARCNGKQRV